MTNQRDSDACSVIPFSNLRQQQIDWLSLMHRQHTIHALLEVDVTEARRTLKAHSRESRDPVSLTAFVIWCVASAIDADKRMHAYRSGRGRLVLFDEVDVTVLIEKKLNGSSVPVPYIVRAANHKQPAGISREIRDAKAATAPQHGAARWLPLWLAVPGALRRLFWRTLLSNPHRRKRMMGTVAVSAVGMFGRGPAWGIPLTPYTLCITLGGISNRQGQESLSITLSADHDVIDGAPAARFAERLRVLVEAGLPAGGPDGHRIRRSSEPAGAG
jgi:pyruvate/2-oxoglutarate dehydrogenase complex dihydrolipoamide acyltransferase (E2) component